MNGKMKLVSLENITKYNELLNKKIVKSVNSVKPDDDGNIRLGTEKSTFNKVVYDTGYFSIGTNAKYEFDLTGSDIENIPKENVNIRLVAKVVKAADGFQVGDIVQLTTTLDINGDYGELDVCTYIRGNTLCVYSGHNTVFSINSGTGWLAKANVQIKAVLTAFIPDDGSILLIAEDQTNTSKLIGLPDGTLTWGDKNIVRSVNNVTADANGNVTISGLEIGDIALAPLGIDETDNCRRYLNGQVILQSQFSKFTEKLKHAITLYPNLATTEQNWQSAVTLSPLGQCGKFVINDEAGTIRLPKVVNVMGALDLSTIGQTVEAGVPNITGNVVAPTELNGTGAFVSKALGPKGYGLASGQDFAYDNLSLNASRSSSIYGNSETVQQEAIKYPYFIQVATSNSKNIQIDTQVRLNNPFSLFMPYWSPIELNNLSWLRSNKQWNNGSVYTSAYEFLLSKYNSGTEQTETIAGVSVTYKLADNGMKIITDKSVYDALISACGSAFFFVLDTENTQFVLPYTNGFAQFGDELGKFTEAGLPNITGTLSMTNCGESIVNKVGSLQDSYANSSHWGGHVDTIRDASLNIVFNASRSSSIYGKSDTVQPNSVTGYLYFYIGEVEQDANIIATSGLAESVSRKLDIEGASRVGMPSDKIISLTVSATGSQYTAPADGYFDCYGGGSVGSLLVLYTAPSGKMRVMTQQVQTENSIATFLPVKKGDKVIFDYARTTYQELYFIYANGAK